MELRLPCPNPKNCGGAAVLGPVFEETLRHAEAGDYIAGCGTCAYTWTPSPAEQKQIAIAVREYLATLHR
jgi:hypothetical protein